MIIRSSFRCLTCGQDHVVRIGMGQDVHQEHRFACRGCGEDMVVALDVDYERTATSTSAVENAEAAPEGDDALVVNVNANFVIDAEQRHVDMAFPHMLQMHEHFERATAFGSINPVAFEEDYRERPRPHRWPDHADEWRLLRKAWSLSERGRDGLAREQIAAASAIYYFDDPLADLPDWVWRFCMFLGATKYELLLRAAMAEIVPALESGSLDAFLADYYAPNADDRGKRYFETFRDYFAAWSEFSQVRFAVAKGIAVSPGHAATSNEFRSARMFYGNAFEAFSSSVDLLALTNNVLEGRAWDRFRTVGADVYLQSDKARRFDAFAERPAFAALAAERDASLRNASHHSALSFDDATGELSYRAGKGGAGDPVGFGYAEYLTKCAELLFQMVTLLRIELLICRCAGVATPV